MAMASLLPGDGSWRLQGSWLVGAITSACSAGFLLFGYDQGVMSGVVISPAWLAAMGAPSDLVIGTITALYDLGAVVGAVLAAFTAEPLGRKRTLLSGAFLVLMGGGLMGAAASRLPFMAARIIVGIGIGFTTSVTPVYQSEISATHQRGWHVCCQLTTMLAGLLLAYCINYALFFHPGDLQWRFPLAFQCVFALYILVVTPFLPDTPRWLMRHDRDPRRGLAVLARLRDRSEADPAVQREKDDIVQAIGLEAKATGAWTELLRPNGVKAHQRFALALGIQFMQQMSGINVVTYFSPMLYRENLGLSEEAALRLGCFTQLWYILASFLTWYLIDRVGRRKLLVSMALGMAAVLVGQAACIGLGTPSAAVGAVVFVLLFEACFTWGWMGCVWVYAPEILPLGIRAKGSALAAAADFVGNFLVVEVTPVGISRLGWRFYLIWAACNLVNAGVVWIWYPETGRLPLEAVDLIFTREACDADVARGCLGRLQWQRVQIAAEMIRESRACEQGHGDVAVAVDAAASTSSGPVPPSERSPLLGEGPLTAGSGSSHVSS